MRSTAVVRAYFCLLRGGRERKRYKGIGEEKKERERREEERTSREGKNGEEGGRKREGKAGNGGIFARVGRESRARRERAENSRLLTRGYQLFFPPLSLSFSPSLNLGVVSSSPSSPNRVNEIPPRLDTTLPLRDTNFFRREEIGVPCARVRPSIDRSMPKMNFSQEWRGKVENFLLLLLFPSLFIPFSSRLFCSMRTRRREREREKSKGIDISQRRTE